MVTYNMRTVTLKLQRHEVCDLLLAVSVAFEESNNANRWVSLHQRIKDQLDAFDFKNLEKEEQK